MVAPVLTRGTGARRAPLLAVAALTTAGVAWAVVAGAVVVWAAGDAPAGCVATEEEWFDSGDLEDLSYPPRIVGRAEAEVLDVDRFPRPGFVAAVQADVEYAYSASGRDTTVTWVDVGHLPEAPEVGDRLEVAFVPTDPEYAWEVSDPGLSDPFENGFLAYTASQPQRLPCAAVPVPLVVAVGAGTVAVVAATVGTASLTASARARREGDGVAP